MSDPTQTCPPAWELITTPRRSCTRPSITLAVQCFSAVFPIEDIQYSQVCGRIIGYQIGQTEALRSYPIEGPYIDGASLLYGRPRQHIWTFASALDEYPSRNAYDTKCPCTNVTEQRPISIPFFVSSDYFYETGAPPGVRWRNSIFYADDPLWDGQGCGPTST